MARTGQEGGREAPGGWIKEKTFVIAPTASLKGSFASFLSVALTPPNQEEQLSSVR